jgi:hypothetical protein
MEPFAIWNLLKTVLSNAESPTAQASAPDAEETKNAVSSKDEPTQSEPARPNACEEYFLRHEQIKSQRKR